MKFSFIFFIISLVLALLVPEIFAASLEASLAPSLIITWKAHNSVPKSYLGKSLPIGKTLISAALQLVENNKLVDLSKNEVRWYMDNRLENSGTGLTNVSFSAPSLIDGSFLLRAVVLNYNKKELNQFLTIPITRPEAVIDGADPNHLRPISYFFNIPSNGKLKIDWGEDKKYITINIQNLTNPLEVAQSSLLKK